MKKNSFRIDKAEINKSSNRLTSIFKKSRGLRSFHRLRQVNQCRSREVRVVAITGIRRE